MSRSTPIALAVLAAFFAAILTPCAAAATVRRHGHPHSAAHARAASAHAPRPGASSRGKSARRISRLQMQPRSRSAMRAHARIREELSRRRRHGRLAPLPAELRPVHLSIPPPLRGSHESLVHQNEMAEAEGLERILDDADLNDRIARGSLVPVPISASLRINTDLPENRRYCRPWTARFLSDLARAHSSRFAGAALEVTSAVRTVAYQRQLRHINGNAAAADGDIASPHLTGGTIDIGKQGMTAREIGWLRGWLIPLEQKGYIDVEEEFKQSCFHISVYKGYTDARTPAPAPADTRRLASGAMLATHGD